MGKILVTGGCGYIGSHTIVDLIPNGYEIISIDNYSRSNSIILNGIERITGRKIKNYEIDLCNYKDTLQVFKQNKDILGVIHFAAYKSVDESVNQPLLYFENNLLSLINILKCVRDFHVPNFIFSSSCTVYGNPDEMPVTEDTPLKPAESPYGHTKQMGEQIIYEFSKTKQFKCSILRYFNPVGAHPSALIGELPIEKPANLVPVIMQTAIGKLPQMKVYGDDYNTRDGTCVRDYIHVCDIANAHTLSLKYLVQHKNNNHYALFNLGSGIGVTVLEMITAFERVSGIKLDYVISKRRSGDIPTIYANNSKSQKYLGWKPKYSLEDMMLTAWNWEQVMSESK